MLAEIIIQIFFNLIFLLFSFPDFNFPFIYFLKVSICFGGKNYSEFNLIFFICYLDFNFPLIFFLIVIICFGGRLSSSSAMRVWWRPSASGNTASPTASSSPTSCEGKPIFLKMKFEKFRNIAPRLFSFVPWFFFSWSKSASQKEFLFLKF